MRNLDQNLTHSYAALPERGKGKGILVLHAWWGLNDFIKSFCQRLAAEGYTVLAPDLYHGKTASSIEEAKYHRSNMKQKVVRDELITAAEHLQRMPMLSGSSHGLIGFSLGGYWGLWLSLEKPDIFRAVTVFYTARNADYSQSQAAYLCHFAESDDWVSKSGIKGFQKSLQSAGRPADFYTYPGTGHWFFENNRPESYHAEAAALAWARSLEFFRLHLGSGTK